MTSPLRLGVNSCLLGEETRYDGGHKKDRYIVNTLWSASRCTTTRATR